MVFVPVSLFASLVLLIVLVWFARTHELSYRAHQLFLGLVALYGMQSLLITLRWGYGLAWAGSVAAFMAPVLPVMAYLSYAALTGPLTPRRLWPLGVIAINWGVLAAAPDLADATILISYLGFGGLLLRLAWTGPDRLALSPLSNAREIILAMALSGGALVASGLVDIYVIVDFVQNDGRNVGLIVSFVQTAFVLLIGVASAFGRVAPHVEADANSLPDPKETPTDQDAGIMARIEQLFETEGLHRSEDLSLRRIARRLQLPDRRVSNAINRSRGLSVSQFVNDWRIKDACRLLTTTQDTILMISLEAGFASKSNFNREFVRVTGTSPSKWRQNGVDTDTS